MHVQVGGHRALTKHCRLLIYTHAARIGPSPLISWAFFYDPSWVATHLVLAS
jgi:hypothetical protein